MYLLINLLLIMITIQNLQSAPVIPRPTHNTVPTTEMFKFMRRFGYLEQNPSDSEALYSEDAIISAIKNVQKYGAIQQTGILDEATLKLMTSARCGVPDISFMNQNRRRRFVVGARSWQKRRITYFIANWSPKVGEEADVANDMKTAFDTWGKYGNLKFNRVYDPSADIIVAFGSGYHGDNYPFDGPGNILAHAFYPYEMGSYGGDIHFDNDENWTRNESTYGDINFLSVAVHELGHSLGLAHSTVYNSIMFPYYKGTTQNNQLDWDDILAMYQLYVQARLADDLEIQTYPELTTEVPVETIPSNDSNEDNEIEPNIPALSTTPSTISTTMNSLNTTTDSIFYTFHGDYETVDAHKERHTWPSTSPTRPSIQIPNICAGHFDAITVIRGEIFIFKNNYVWRLSETFHLKPGYPVDFRQIFPELNVTHIDAAYERDSDGKIILFSGNQYWIHDGSNFINSPRPLTDFGIDPDTNSLNAAIVWAKNNRTYLFSGNKFWRFDDGTQHLDDGYPMSMIRWHGIPENVDAAVTLSNGQTFFFKGQLYWRYNNKWVRPEINYPRLITTLLGCQLIT